jgi:hypothetical protein
MKIKKSNVPLGEQLLNIATVIKDNLNGMNPNNLDVFIYVDKETITKINEDFYYKHHPDAKSSDFNPETDELNIVVDGINFTYTTQIQ